MSGRDLHEQVFDRQTRIWGGDAQQALEGSNVCLINASAAGTEALKSLILPGLGKFTVVDDAVVTKTDLGKNFFLELSDLGKPRAEAVAKHLQVHGVFLKQENAIGIKKDPLELLKTNPDFFKQFHLIIVSGCPNQVAVEFSKFCAATNTALVVVRAYSQVGEIQLYSKEHVIFDSHSEIPVKEYRAHNPWKELEDYCATVLPENVPLEEHGRIPWLAVLVNASKKWAAIKGRRIVQEDEVKEFKEMLNQWQFSAFDEGMKKRFPDGVPASSGGEDDPMSKIPAPPFENYAEAAKNWSCLSLEPKSPEVEQILKEMEQKENGTHPSGPLVLDSSIESKFWVMVAGLRLFIKEAGGVYPVCPRLPDMEPSSSAMFTSLQKCYSERAKVDAAQLEDCTVRELKRLSTVHSVTGDADKVKIQREEYVNFAAHSLQLGCLHSPPLLDLSANAAVKPSPSAVKIGQAIEEVDPSAIAYFNQYMTGHNLAFLPLLAAADDFYEKYGRFPGQKCIKSSDSDSSSASTSSSSSSSTSSKSHSLSSSPDIPRVCAPLSKSELEADVELFRENVRAVCAAHSISPSLAAGEVTHEFVRLGGGEMHSVAAVMGGLAAQESFKLLTHSFTPLHNTMVFHGFTCASEKGLF
ncbi:putative amyloid beta precursor protein-binding protein 1 [Monocercomonoides exilis]|uniref:putative amyloid beta precursor protein-binding protein 1 n=1 Tax=Monocercomonoides exilis TaxID=2049356 RepID=UPI00355A7BC3|nr:putative amyloid beta precursor protein-binding protein 1 [Monocercomonoides exilis]|eukprot:MONOS_5116.1-p1 / transcript=MONOS_5116.1 / gene=MONOS_5116 / organism=Monocercomonoides_exilis_PA203 / gene_product=amyloid beta precursor protein-binding protein 1 / transcript_product=amyloid beta precursor protein-binding protein 1 / location=Mono_scaffold00145:69058-71154(+) / protein_length=637 / sequence_SO=supercontig / SO=protein_coding / is_pseudo=false